MFKKPNGYKNINTSQTQNYNKDTYFQKIINYFKYCLNI